MNITVDTLEYLSPELLEYYSKVSKNPENKDALLLNLYNSSKKWSFDVWAFGIVLVEVVAGVPVWLDVRSKLVTADNKPKLGEGLFIFNEKGATRN